MQGIRVSLKPDLEPRNLPLRCEQLFPEHIVLSIPITALMPIKHDEWISSKILKIHLSMNSPRKGTQKWFIAVADSPL